MFYATKWYEEGKKAQKENCCVCVCVISFETALYTFVSRMLKQLLSVVWTFFLIANKAEIVTKPNTCSQEIYSFVISDVK